MGIPLFTGQVGIPQNAPRAFPVENLDPRLYTEGLKASQLDPSTTTSIVRGLAQAGEYIDDSNLNQARTRALDESTRIAAEQAPYESELLQAQAANYRQDAALAPQELQIRQSQAQTAQLNAQVEAQEAKQKADAITEQLQRKVITNNAFDQVRQGNVADGLTELETNFSDVMRVALRPEGQGFVPDPGVISQIGDLVYRAQKTNDPALVERAQNLVGRFQESINRSNRISDGKKPVEFLDESLTGAPKKQADALEESLRESGAFETEEFASKPQPTAPTDYAQPRSTAGRDLVFPSPDPGFAFEEKDTSGAPKAYTERFYNAGVEKLANEKIDKRAAQLLEKYPDLEPGKALEIARTETKMSNFSVSENTKMDKLIGSHAELVDIYSRARETFNQLEGWMEKAQAEGEGFKPGFLDFGESNNVPFIIKKLKAKYRGNPESARALDEIDNQLNAIGSLAGIKKLLAAGAGTKAFDTEAEQKRITGLEIGRDKSLRDNLEGVEQLGGSVQRVADRIAIIDTAKRRGLDFGAADSLARQYELSNPTTGPGIVNGEPGVTQNQNRESPFSFLDRVWDVKKYFHRDKDGRVTSHEPIENPLQHSNEIAREAEEFSLNAGKSPFDLSSLNPFSATEAQAEETTPEDQIPYAASNNIPPRQPGGVNNATIRKMIGVESAWDMRAVSPVGAKGLMQLMDPTGKELWEKMDFEGDYDPFNAQKNVMMGTLYMNQLLPLFDNDTRLALAAYNMGPGALKKAYDKAEKHLGDTSWEAVKQYIPKANKETIPYVEKIFGTPEMLAKEERLPVSEETPGILASLSSTRAQVNAQQRLSPKGMAALKEASTVTDFESAAGTLLEKITEALMDLNPFDIKDVEAEEPKKEAGAAKKESEGPEGSKGGLDFSTVDMTPEAGAQMIASIFGAARGVFWGWDDEAFAPFRMILRGEDWETALNNTRAVREHFQQQYPAYYTGGQIAGSVAGFSGVAKGLGALKKSLGLGRPAVTMAQKIAQAEKAASLGSSVKRGATIGAASGVVAGAGESEGGLDNRMTGAGVGAVVGTGLGVGMELAIAGGSAALRSDTAKDLFGKAGSIYQKLKGQKATPKPDAYTAAEKEIVPLLPQNPQKLARTEARMKSSTNPAASLLDELQGTNIESAADKASKQTSVSTRARDVVEGRTNITVDRIKNFFTSRGLADNTTPTEANTALAKGAERVVNSLEDEKRVLGKQVYDRAKASLPDIKSERGYGARQAIPDTEGNIIVDARGRATQPEVQRYRRGKIESEAIPGFAGDEVLNALKNPKTKEAIKQAHGNIDPDNLLPDSSFDILQHTKSLLRENSQNKNLPPAERNVTKEAFEELRAAMHKESDLYRKADELYKAKFEKVEDETTDAINTIRSFLPGETTNVNELGNRLLNFDTQSLKQVKDLFRQKLGQQGERLLQNSMLYKILEDPARIVRQIQDEGGKKLGKGLGDKIRTVWSGKAGAEIIRGLKEESKIAKSSGVITTVGSRTALRNEKELQEISDQVKGQLGRAVAYGAGAIGLSSAGAPGFGIGLGITAGISALRTLPGVVRAGRLKTEQQFADAISKIFVEDKTAGLNFLAKVRENLVYEKSNEGIQAWKKITELVKNNIEKGAGAADAAVATGVVAESGLYKPETRQRADEESQEAFKGLRSRRARRASKATDITIQGPGITQ